MQFSFLNDNCTCFHLSETFKLFSFLILLLSSQSSWSANELKWLLHLPKSLSVQEGSFAQGSSYVDSASSDVAARSFPGA